MPHPQPPTTGHRPTALLGAGGHARVLIEALTLAGRTVCCAYDDDPALLGRSVCGVTIKGTLDATLSLNPEEFELVNGIGSVAVPIARMRVYERFTQRGFRFATAVHPSAVVSPSATLGPGVQVMAGAVIQCNTTVGADVLINTRASVDHDCTVGDHTHLAPGTTLSGSVKVGRATHLGSGATVIQGVTIGDNVLIGAGAVVTRDLPTGSVAVGVPARVRESR